MDFAPTFQMGHPLPFVLAERLAAIAPGTLKHVFFTNSGSESVDTALKIALAYHRVRGEGQRTRLIGREKGYHGVGFGGISVGGMPNNRKYFGAMLPGVDHLRHTLDIERNAFSRGLPQYGAELAEDLERLVALHDASTIAAVIVEPISGSAGVVLPPEGYLQRLREICTKHGILLIFDEVITGFGRVGKAFAAQRFGVTPDLITTAKGLTNGSVPMGAVFVSEAVHDSLHAGARRRHRPLPRLHLFRPPARLRRGAGRARHLRGRGAVRKGDRAGRRTGKTPCMACASLPNVIDIRNFGLIGAVELAPRPGQPGARGYEVFTRCFHDQDLLIRCTGDVIALSPPLMLGTAHIDGDRFAPRRGDPGHALSGSYNGRLFSAPGGLDHAYRRPQGNQEPRVPRSA